MSVFVHMSVIFVFNWTRNSCCREAACIVISVICAILFVFFCYCFIAVRTSAASDCLEDRIRNDL